MPLTPASFQAVEDDYKALVVSLTEDATHNTDSERRAASASWLGLMKYDDELTTQYTYARSPGVEVLYRVATAKLPAIDAFILSARAEQLRHVVEGMVLGLGNHAPDLRHGYVSNPYTISLLSELVADISQDDDLFVRQRAGRRIGALKHDIEHGLLDPEKTAEQYTHLETEVTAIDDLIAVADRNQLVDIIRGFTAAIHK